MPQTIWQNADDLATALAGLRPAVATNFRRNPNVYGQAEGFFNTALTAARTLADEETGTQLDIDLIAGDQSGFNRTARAIEKAATNRRFR